jgi:hypothetical protein
MPTLPAPLLLVCALPTALLAIVSAPWGFDQPWLNFVFKPLTTLLIIGYAWPRRIGQPMQRGWVLAGLAGRCAATWPCCGRSRASCLDW